MTSKLVVNTIEADTGISSVSFASSISMSSTSVFHFSDAGVNIGADTNISRLGNGILGFKINGAEKFRIDSSGHIKAVGVCTATHFYGDGSNLTGITGTTINGNTNNYVVTATGTANTLQGEANLTWDATTLKVQAATPAIEISGTNSNGGNSSLHFNANANHWVLEADNYTSQNIFSIKSGTPASSTARLSIDSSGNVGLNGITNPSSYDGWGRQLVLGSTTGHGGLTIVSGNDSGEYGHILFADGTGGTPDQEGAIGYHHNTNFMYFRTNNSERVRIDSNGGVGIGTNNFSGQLNNEVGLAVHSSSNDNCRISITTPTKSNSRIGYFGLSNRFGMDVHNGFEIRDAEASYATRFKIDNNGYVTMNQPYGYVRFNSNTDNGGEQKQTDVYTHTVQNGMSHSSGRLTVPATGKYYIGIHGNILDDGNAAQYLYINGSKTNGFRWQLSDTDSAWKSSMVSAVIALSANDYLEVYVTGRQDNQAWNVFTVYMLG